MDHTVYTRLYIVSAFAQIPDAQTVAGRLLRNQEDIGNAIVPYYGKDAGMKLTELLKQHIVIATEVVAAAMSGDKNKFAESDKKWVANADDIAAFLSPANPNWPKKDAADLLHLHLQLIKEFATARLSKKYDEDIKNSILHRRHANLRYPVRRHNQTIPKQILNTARIQSWPFFL